MKQTALIASAVLTIGILAGLTPPPALAQGEIYGTVYTNEGKELTGSIRWDKNEAFWDDIINASKTDRVWSRDRREGMDFRIFGLQFFHTGRSHRMRVHSEFSIPFGHVTAIEPMESNRVRVELKNGETFTVREGADLGSRVRGIVVNRDGVETKLKWRDLERVEFASNTQGEMDGKRLYGTLETSMGEVTGYIVWDLDEALTTDILDGEDGGHDRKIPFAEIQSIEKASRKASRVTLKSGEEVRLRGTNDVDNDNRGILVTIRDMGTARVDWDEFRRLTFSDPPPSPRYEDFDGGRLLNGTVTTRDGQTLSGDIIWDKDEKFTWETLGGNIKDVYFEIHFRHIARIEKASRFGATVTLRDGITLTLKDTNDVNYRNKGIVILKPDGEKVTLGWKEFASVEFAEH